MKSLMLVSNDVVRDTRVLQEARSLVRAKYDVTIVGWDRENVHPTGELSIDGIDIRLLKSTSLMKIAPSMVIRSTLWWRSAFRQASEVTYDLVHSHDLDTLQTGVRLKKRRKVPLLFDAHEIFAYMIEGDYPKTVMDYATRMERRLVKSADHVVTVNDRLKAHYEALTDKHVTVVMNCREDIAPKYTPPSNDVFTVVYIGNLHKSRYILELINVVQKMEGVRLLIGGHKELAEEVRRRCAGHVNTTFLGEVPNDEVLRHTAAADAVFCMFDPGNRNNQVGSPNKIFEAMAVGRPVIVTRGILSGDIVEKERCGLAVEYTEAALRTALETLREDPAKAQELGRNGLAAARREYNWGVQEKHLLAAVRSLAG